MSTKEKLAKALKEAGAPLSMITLAEQGHYDDYESDLANPISQLVADCFKLKLEDMAHRAMNGDFDATKEESEAWFQKEGKDLLK